MPTIKQKRAFKAIGENGGVVSKAMETAGYSKTITHATEKLTNSKGWQELMEQHLPDKLLAKVHHEGLKAGKRIFKNNNESGEIEDMGVEPDYATRHKYLDSAYKLKGAYAPEKHETATVIVDISKILEKTYGKEDK